MTSEDVEMENDGVDDAAGQVMVEFASETGFNTFIFQKTTLF